MSSDGSDVLLWNSGKDIQDTSRSMMRLETWDSRLEIKFCHVLDIHNPKSTQWHRLKYSSLLHSSFGRAQTIRARASLLSLESRILNIEYSGHRLIQWNRRHFPRASTFISASSNRELNSILYPCICQYVQCTVHSAHSASFNTSSSSFSILSLSLSGIFALLCIMHYVTIQIKSTQHNVKYHNA